MKFVYYRTYRAYVDTKQELKIDKVFVDFLNDRIKGILKPSLDFTPLTVADVEAILLAEMDMKIEGESVYDFIIDSLKEWCWEEPDETVQYTEVEDCVDSNFDII